MTVPAERPIELLGRPRFGLPSRGRVANSRNMIHLSWATFSAHAEFRVTPGQGNIDEWSVGFVQRILLVSNSHCYRRLSGPAMEPSSRPIEEGPVLVVRTSLPRTRRYPLDQAQWRSVRWARPPIVSAGVPFPISASYTDTPSADKSATLERTFPDGSAGSVAIHSSSVWAQFFVTVAARHDPSNIMYPFWNARWNLRARYFHVRYLHASVESQRDATCDHVVIVDSEPGGHDMGAHGYVRAPGSDEVPANQAQMVSEEWTSSCPEP